MAVSFPVIIPLVLGRLINLATYDVGSNIFDDQKYKEVNVTEGNLQGAYWVTKDLDEKFMTTAGIPLDIALRIKLGDLSTPTGQMGLDGFLNDIKSFNNSVYIVVAGSYFNAYREIPQDSKPFDKWENLVLEGGDNAYVSQITYGGWFVALHRLICQVHDDVDALAETVLEVAGEKGAVDKEVFPKTMEKLIKTIAELSKELRGSVSHEVRVYSSTPIPNSLITAEDILKAIDDLPNLVTKDGKIGEPLSAIFGSIHDLNNSFPAYEYHQSSYEYLSQIFNIYDDPAVAERSLINWMNQIQDELDEYDENQVHELFTSLATVNTAIENAIYGLSLYSDPPESLVQEALSVYESEMPDDCNSYREAYKKLRERIGVSCTDEMENVATGIIDEDMDYRLNAFETKGREECRDICIKISSCRSISFAYNLTVLNEETDLWEEKHNLCWLFASSTNTAGLTDLPDMIGKIYTDNRNCGIY